MLIDLSNLPPRERARRYCELAREARLQASVSRERTQVALVKLAVHWEQMEREADAEATENITVEAAKL
jgi:hypothetical protein